MADKTKVRRKPDPTMERKDITMGTFEKIKEYLKTKDDFIYKTELNRNLNINYNSVNIALAMLEDNKLIEYDESGRIKLRVKNNGR